MGKLVDCVHPTLAHQGTSYKCKGGHGEGVFFPMDTKCRHEVGGGEFDLDREGGPIVFSFFRQIQGPPARGRNLF